MPPSSRTVTYSLQARTGGIPGLQRFQRELERIFDLQERLKRQGDTLSALQAQVAPAVEAARREAQAAREAAQAKKAAANEYSSYRRRQLSEEEQAERRAHQEGMQRLRDRAATAQLNARLSNQADREAAQATRAAMQARREAIDGLRLDYSRLRTALDAMTISEAEFNQGGDAIIRKLKAMGDTAEFTARELKQLSDLEGRIAREQNTLAGVVNPVGFSGNVAVGIRSALPGILAGLQQVTALSPSLGAAAAQVTGIAQGLQSVRVAAQGAAPHTLQLATGMNTSATAAGFLRGGAAGAGGAITTMGGAAAVAGAAIGGLVVALGAGAVAAGRAVNEYSKLESALAKVSTLTDKLPAQLGGVRGDLQQMARDYGASVEQLAAGLYDILGASVAGTEDMGAAMKFLETATKLATAGATDASVATDVLTSVMNAYKLNASDAGTVSDKLFKTVDLGKVSFQQLAQSLGMVTAISSQAGVSLDEVLAALATMTANGVQASSAVDYLRSLISSIVGPSEKAASTAKQLGINFNESALKSKGLTGVLQEVIEKTGGSTAKMKDLFGGVEAVTAATSIATGNFGRMKDSMTGIANAAGATETAYSKMADTLEKKTEKVGQGWKTLWQNVGAWFAPVKLDILNFMDDWLDKLNQAITRTNTARAGQREVGDIEAQIARQQGIINYNTSRKENALLRAKGAQGDPITLGRIREEIAGVDAAIIDARAEIARLQMELTAARGHLALQNAQSGVLPGPNTGGPPSKAPPMTPEQMDAVTRAQAFFQAIFGQETGGRGNTYGVVNSIGALGKYQVMAQHLLFGDAQYSPSRNTGAWFQANRSNRGTPGQGWDFEALGRDITPDEFLKNPAFQEAIAQAQMAKNLQKRLLEAGGDLEKAVKEAAKDWYGRGKPLPGHPTPDQYAASVWAKYQTQAARLTGEKPTPGTGTPPPSGNDVQVTSALIVKAQQLLGRVEAAQKAAQASPGNAALKVAYSNATKELEAFTKANEANAAAVKAVSDTQGQAARSAGQYIATQADLKKYGNDALRLYKALEVAQRSGSAAAVTAAERNIAAWQGESKARKAAYDAEVAAYKVRQGSAGATLKTQQDLQKALADGREQDARRLLDQLKAQQARELDLARDSAAKRAQIIAQTGPAILAAEDRIANLKRDRAVKDAQRQYDEARKLPGADLGALDAIRREQVRQAYATATAERAAARRQQAQAEQGANREALAAQQQHERERKAILARNAEEGRNLTISAAEQRLAAIKSINERELASFKGTAEERLRLIKRQSQAEYQAALDLANAQKIVALQRSANEGGPNQAERDRQIRANYTQTVQQLGATRAATVQAEVDREKAAVRELRDEYSKLADALREKITAGTVTQEDLTAYWESIVKIGKAGQQAGVSGNTFLQAAQLGAKGVYALAQGTVAATEKLRELREEFERTADEMVASTEQAFDEKNNADSAEVARLKRLGPGLMLNFLGGPGNTNFGDKFWTRLGVQGREEFMAALNSFNADDFAKLPQSLLQNWAAMMGDDAQWAGVKAQVLAAIGKITDDVGRLADAKIEGQLKALDLQRAQETITEDDYQAQRTALLTTQETERWAREKKALEVRGYKAGDSQYELAFQEHQNRLTDIAIGGVKKRVDAEKGGQEETASILDVRRNPVQSFQEDIDNLTALFNEGQLTAAEYTASLDVAVEGLEAMAAEAERLGNHALAAQFRAAAQQTRELNPELVKMRQELKTIADFGQNFQKFTSGLSSIFKSFGADGLGAVVDGLGAIVNEASRLPTQFKEAEKAWEAFKKKQSVGTLGDLLGGIGGFLGSAGAVIGAIGQVGDALLDLSPIMQKNRREWAELAQASQQAMGNQYIGGGRQHGWLNPYYDALKKDAEGNSAKANAGFWQWVGWTIFGGAPKTLDKAAAEHLQQTSQVFNEFGGSLYSTMEQSLMDAIDQGDFSKVAGNVDTMLNRFVQQLYVRTLLAKSNLKTLVEALAEEQVRDGDTTDEIAAIRSEVANVLGIAQSGAPALPGFGAGADSSGRPGSSPAGDPVVGANFYVANSSKIDLFDNVIQRADAMYLRHEGILTRHADVLSRHADMLDRVMRDGIRLIDGDGNTRGAFRT